MCCVAWCYASCFPSTRFAPHFTRATSGSTSVGGGSSGGGQGDQMPGDGDQLQEKEVATDVRTLDMDDGSSLSSTDIGVCFVCVFS